ncbi:MAG: hypothetical protein KF685_01180 [Acidobacteria bacterium]|nr:hypothetical protein [Acidobacteriota bacterium]
MKINLLFCCAFLLITALTGFGQDASPTPKKDFDAALAKKVGADKYGMRNYVFVLLKTGPKTEDDAKKRNEIFAGHFANMNRLAEEGKLVLAGPFDGVEGWRGMFIFNVESIEEAKKLTETDPVLKSGLMIAEYHKYYGSAALMEINERHKKVAETDF